MFYNFETKNIETNNMGNLSHRKAAKGEHLPIYEENRRVVTACCHLHTRTWQGLHQSGRTPSKGKNI